MSRKERFLYISKILVLIGVIGWLLYTDSEDYVKDYSAKLDALEKKVDSLHFLNDELTFKIDTLNLQISKLDSEIDIKDNKINNLRNEINIKVNAVDSFNDNELEKFFTKRYKYLFNTTTDPNSQRGN